MPSYEDTNSLPDYESDMGGEAIQQPGTTSIVREMQGYHNDPDTPPPLIENARGRPLAHVSKHQHHNNPGPESYKKHRSGVSESQPPRVRKDDSHVAVKGSPSMSWDMPDLDSESERGSHVFESRFGNLVEAPTHERPRYREQLQPVYVKSCFAVNQC